MRGSLKRRYVVKKNRLKGHGVGICRDFLQAALLLTAITLLTAAFIYSYNYLISSPYFLIKNTLVRGCRELTEKEVLALAALKPSQTIFAVNIESMSRRITSHPWIKSVAIGREFPQRLVVDIRERATLALCKREGELYLVDKDGVLFKKLETGDDVDVPVLTGYFREGRLDKELFENTLLLIKVLAASKSFPTLNAVAEINGSGVSGLSLYTENGFCLQLGFGNYQSKLRRLLPVITALNKKNMNSGLLNIDLRDTGKVYVERRGVAGSLDRLEGKKGLST